MQPSSYPPPVPNEDAEHLRKLSVAHYIYAALQGFFVLFGLTFFGLALAMIAQPEWFQGSEPPPVLTSAVFMGIGLAISVASIGFAFCTFKAGKALLARQHYSYCMGLAAFNCLWMPLGTILGIFTLIVLSRPTVKAMFGRA